MQAKGSRLWDCSDKLRRKEKGQAAPGRLYRPGRHALYLHAAPDRRGPGAQRRPAGRAGQPAAHGLDVALGLVGGLEHHDDRRQPGQAQHLWLYRPRSGHLQAVHPHLAQHEGQDPVGGAERCRQAGRRRQCAGHLSAPPGQRHPGQRLSEPQPGQGGLSAFLPAHPQVAGLHRRCRPVEGPRIQRHGPARGQCRAGCPHPHPLPPL